MYIGDQLHDTLHQTRVRREIAANERQAYLERGRQELGALLGRFAIATQKVRNAQRECSDCFRKAEGQLLQFRQRAETALQEMGEADADGWYALQAPFEASLEKLREEVLAVELLAS